MIDMSIQEMISALVDKGWSQHSIAEKIGTTQPTIHRASKGSDVRYELGKAIERLHSEVFQPEAGASEAA